MRFPMGKEAQFTKKKKKKKKYLVSGLALDEKCRSRVGDVRNA